MSRPVPCIACGIGRCTHSCVFRVPHTACSLGGQRCHHSRARQGGGMLAFAVLQCSDTQHQAVKQTRGLQSAAATRRDEEPAWGCCGTVGYVSSRCGHTIGSTRLGRARQGLRGVGPGTNVRAPHPKVLGRNVNVARSTLSAPRASTRPRGERWTLRWTQACQAQRGHGLANAACGARIAAGARRRRCSRRRHRVCLLPQRRCIPASQLLHFR